MTSIQEDILDDFFKKLEDLEEFDEQRVAQLRELFSSQKKPNPANIVAALAAEPSEEIP